MHILIQMEKKIHQLKDGIIRSFKPEMKHIMRSPAHTIFHNIKTIACAYYIS
jgi:hypothetical protein